MKHIALRTAVAATLSMAAGHAFALPATEVTGTATVLYVGGATATDNSFENLGKINTGYCVAGTLDIYNISNNRLLFCSASATSGLTGKIALLKESNGGSANGVRSVANLAGSGFSALSFITFTQDNLSAHCGAGTLVAASGDFSAHRTHTCDGTTLTQLVVPEAGVSDIDPDTFVGIGNVTQGMADALASVTSVGIPFNPIVSLPLYLTMQKAQGLISSSASALNQIDDSSIDKMPSIASSTVRGVFTQQLLLQSQLYSDGISAGANSVLLSSLLPAGIVSTTADTFIHVCRRGNTSGTMASFKILFLGEGCSKNSGSIAPFVLPDDASCTEPGCGWIAASYGDDLVFAGASSGNVRSCVDYHSGIGNFAVGVASVENKPNSTNNRYRYVRVDGVAPTLDNVIKGNYQYYTENTLNEKIVGGPSGTDATLWGFIKANIGLTAVVAKVNEAFQNAGAIGIGGIGTGTGQADTGILGIPSLTDTLKQPSFPISIGEGRTTPINSMSRVYGSDPNNCNMSIQVIPTP